MTKHTPGPWHVNGRSIDSIDRRTVATTEGIYRRERGRPEEQEANARLIAAAPELLAALHDLTLRADDTEVAGAGYSIDTAWAHALLARIEGEV
jgi:hypothetical protein